MKYFLIYCAESFANRYGALIAGITLSRLCDLEPKIIWHSNHMFRSEFYDIFSPENNFEVLNAPISEYFNIGKNYNLFSWDNNPYLNFFEHDVCHHPKNLDIESFRSLVNDSDKPVFYYTPFLNDWIPKEEVKKTIQSIKFNKEIEKSVNKFIVDNNLINGYEGIHIRLTDNQYLFNLQDIDLLINNIKKNNHKKFFLCSDNPDIEKKFNEYSNVYVFPKKYKTEKLFPNLDWRLEDHESFKNEDQLDIIYNVERGNEHCKESAIDFLLLSNSNLYYTSNYSTFSQLSKIIGESIRENKFRKSKLMYYYYPTTLANHWNDITQMIDENYAHEYNPNDLLIMGIHHHHSIEKIKSENLGHGKVIIYQLEPLNKSHWWGEDHIIPILKDADEVWDYDLDNIKKLKSHGIDAKFKPFLYTEKLKRVKNIPEPDIDILFYGTLSDYRYKFLEKINHGGIEIGTTVCAFALTEEILDEFIGRSKIIIDLQLTDKEKFIQKQSRLYYAIINNKCVLSEKSFKNYYGDLILEADNNIDDVLNQATFLLTTEKWKDYSNNSEKFKQMTITDMIDNATNNKENMSIKIVEILNEFNINGFDKEGGTDKDGAHSYVEIYQELLEPFTEKEGSFLEIGVRFGGSLLLWNQFLPKFKIFALEVEDNLHENIRQYISNNSDKIFLEFKDAYVQETAEYIKSLSPEGFNIIVDDGPHTEESQIKCIQLYLNLLKDDGILIIEDIQNFNSVEVLRNSIIKSDLYDYEVTIYDHREKKGMYDDVIFAVRKKRKQVKNKIAIFYHLYQTDDYEWEKLYHQQINSLIVSGLYDKCDFIHIGINGDKELPFTLSKMKVQYNENKILEANTLQSLWEFCRDNLDYKVLYFHSKGVTHKNNVHCETTTNAWRIYLEYFVIHKWPTCIEDLNHCDCVGPEWITSSSFDNFVDQIYIEHQNSHFAGNFWWANASYILSLDLDYLYSTEGDYDRFRSEFWIGTKNPNYKSYHNSNKLLYEFYYSPEYYATLDEKEPNDSISMKNKVFIITPCTRPLYLSKISESIPEECEWIVVFDNKIKNEHSVDNATTIKSPFTGFRGYPNKNYGLDYIANNLNPTDNDWVVILHDDNIIHPDWWDAVKNHLNSNHSMITWGQCFSDETPKINPVESPKIGNIDTAQYMVRWDIAKNLRYQNVYEADGIYAEESANRGPVLAIPEYLSYHNFLRSHKKGNSIRSNICMISMFKNESKGILRMLESVWQHIDFYIFQDNGSTDGTADIVREFFADKNVPGFIYEVEEGWVSFGWNRDHLLQTALRNDHGCDWIMKMDCDEYLEVDDDFDWSPFYTSDKQAFHVTAMAPGCIYFRAWIWNANYPWKFKHDVAHECIYLDDGVTGENFSAQDLQKSFRMIGTPDGESYTVRTKYISDALKLEEKLIREETMLTDLYHFWYTAKSYHDCYAGDFYPFGSSHSKEFARRAIYYYQHYVDHIKQEGFHEMTYFSKFSIGDLYKYLGDVDKAIEYYKDAERHCPIRNEHIVCLARTYHELGQYDKMLEQTTRLMQEDRKLPFPNVCFLLDSNIYCDSGPIPQHLHNLALQLTAEKPKQIISLSNSITNFSINTNQKPTFWIVDDFYNDPHTVREFALQQEFEANISYYKGSRTKQQFIVPGTKEAFEKIMGRKITHWTETHGMCGRFQYCTAEDDLVYHCDSQTFAGMIYLTPDAPHSCGTSLFAHKKTGLRNENDFGNVNVFEETGFYDRSKFELVDTAGNVFNRLVLFDAKSIHSANEYFGTDITNSRLFQLFFFD